MQDPLDLSSVAETKTIVIGPSSNPQFPSEPEQQVNRLLSGGWELLTFKVGMYPNEGPVVQLSIGRFYAKSKDAGRIAALRLFVVRAGERRGMVEGLAASGVALDSPEIYLNGLLEHDDELWIILEAVPMLDREGPFVLYLVARLGSDELPEGVARVVRTKLFAVWPSSVNFKTETGSEEELNDLLKGGWEPITVGSLSYPGRGPVVLVSVGLSPDGEKDGIGGRTVSALRVVPVTPAPSPIILNDAQIYVNGLLEDDWKLLRVDPAMGAMGQMIMVYVVAQMKEKSKGKKGKRKRRKR